MAHLPYPSIRLKNDTVESARLLLNLASTISRPFCTTMAEKCVGAMIDKLLNREFYLQNTNRTRSRISNRRSLFRIETPSSTAALLATMRRHNYPQW
jgi:hypothetical protein